MAAAKRNVGQREQDLLFIEGLYVKGKSQREIAQELSAARDYTVSHKTVGRDIAALLSRWRETACREINELKAAELARLNRLEREAWDEWERSKLKRERTLTEKRTGDNPGERAQIVKENLLGDPRYLQAVQWCIDKRCKILGLDAPVKVAPTDPSGENPYAGATDAELLELAKKLTGGATNDAARTG